MNMENTVLQALNNAKSVFEKGLNVCYIITDGIQCEERYKEISKAIDIVEQDNKETYVEPFHKCNGKNANTLIENSHYDFCPYCGKPINWENYSNHSKKQPTNLYGFKCIRAKFIGEDGLYGFKFSRFYDLWMTKAHGRIYISRRDLSCTAIPYNSKKELKKNWDVIWEEDDDE